MAQSSYKANPSHSRVAPPEQRINARSGVDADDPIVQVYEQHKHLDILLSDREWLGASDNPDGDEQKLNKMYAHYLWTFWQAIKTYIKDIGYVQQE